MLRAHHDGVGGDGRRYDGLGVDDGGGGSVSLVAAQPDQGSRPGHLDRHHEWVPEAPGNLLVAVEHTKGLVEQARRGENPSGGPQHPEAIVGIGRVLVRLAVRAKNARGGP